MFRFPKLLILLTIIYFHSYSQEILTKTWQQIDSSFVNEDYHSVIHEVPLFIKRLDSLNFSQKKVPPYIFLGSSLYFLGKCEPADSIFEIVNSIARLQRDSSLEREIKRKHLDALKISLKKHKSDAKLTKYFLAKIKKLAEELQLFDEVIINYYKTALYQYEIQNLDSAIFQLEQALTLISEEKLSSGNLTKIIYEQLAKYYFEFGDIDNAISYYKLTEKEKKFQLLNYAASLLEKRENYLAADSVMQIAERDSSINFGITEVISYLKNRIKHFKKIDKDFVVLDTLRIMIERIKFKKNLEDSVYFSARKFYINKCIELGKASEAKNEIETLYKQIPSDSTYHPLLQELNLLSADIAFLMGNFSEALKKYKQIDSIKKLSNSALLSIKNNLGLSLLYLGEYNASVQEFLNLDSLAYEVNNYNYSINAKYNLGIISLNQEKIEDAIKSFEDVRKLANEKSNAELEILSTLRLAECYQMLGLPSQNYFNDIEDGLEEIYDPDLRISILLSLAKHYINALDYQHAEFVLKKSIKTSQENGLSLYTYDTHLQLAAVKYYTGEYNEAIDYYLVCCNLIEQTDDFESKALISIKLAQCYTQIMNYTLAYNFAEKAISICAESEKSDSLVLQNDNIDNIYWYAISLTALSQVKYFEGIEKNDIEKIYEAYHESNRAVDILIKNFNTHFVDYGYNEDLWAKNVNSFHLLVSILKTLYEITGEQKYIAEAFEVNEKLRSQTFIIDMGEKLYSNISSEIIGDDQENIVPKNSSFSKLTGLTLGNENFSSFTLMRSLKKKITHENEIFEKQRDYNSILERINNSKSNLSELVQTKSISYDDVKSLLRSNEVLLSYLVQPGATYIILVSKAKSQFLQIDISEKLLLDMVYKYRKLLEDPYEPNYKNLSIELYNLLIKPIANLIENRHILLIPSGSLFSLPFGALHNGQEFISEKSTISILPNATYLRLAQRGLSHDIDYDYKLLALGNPLNPAVSRLPGAEEEAISISKIIKSNSLLLGESATESFIKENISKYEIVHLACHGFYNYEYPLLSFLALSPDIKNDGFIKLHEIYELGFLKTNLVILSACETALAQIKSNDDIIGFIRGFLFLGVPNVVGSLWRVDDYSTSLLMEEFYKRLSLGKSISRSLQIAQKKLIVSQMYNHPFYWAAFSVNGIGE